MPGINVGEFGTHQNKLGRVIDPDEHDHDRSRRAVGRFETLLADVKADQQFPTSNSAAVKIDDDLDMGQATAEEVQRAAESLGRPNPQRAELFRWRLRDGCVCFVARSGSAIVAYVWMRYSPELDDGLPIALGPGEVYSFDLFVDENWRGRRIFAALGSRSRLFLKDRGYTTGEHRRSH